MKDIKVGLIYYKYPLYEKGSYIQEFIDSLSFNCKKIVLISSPYPNKNFTKPDNLKIIWIPLFKIPLLGDLFFNFFVFLSGLKKDFRAVDIINVVSARGAFAAFLLGKIFKKPVICTIEIINNEEGKFFDRIFYIIQKYIYKLNFQKIICWADYYYDNYLEKWGISKEEIEIIPGGININRYNPNINGENIRKKFPSDTTLIVFAKPMFEYNRKLAEILLDSIKSIADDFNIYILLGRGEQMDIIKRKIVNLNLEKRAFFMPFVPITEIPKYLAASDIIVLPFTYAATTSRSLLEAMAMGKPIITSNVGEISNVVRDRKEALLVNPKKEEISKAIKTLIKNKELALKISANARKLVETRYSIEKIISETTNVYGEVIDKEKNKKI